MKRVFIRSAGSLAALMAATPALTQSIRDAVAAGPRPPARTTVPEPPAASPATSRQVRRAKERAYLKRVKS